VPGALVKAGETNGPGLGQGSSLKQPRRDELGWPGDARDATRKDQKIPQKIVLHVAGELENHGQ